MARPGGNQTSVVGQCEKIPFSRVISWATLSAFQRGALACSAARLRRIIANLMRRNPKATRIAGIRSPGVSAGTSMVTPKTMLSQFTIVCVPFGVLTTVGTEARSAAPSLGLQNGG